MIPVLILLTVDVVIAGLVAAGVWRVVNEKPGDDCPPMGGCVVLAILISMIVKAMLLGKWLL